MDSDLPFLLIRAVPRAEVLESFGRWFTSVHLRDVQRIPGFKDVRHARSKHGGVLGVYTFSDPTNVEETLASPEAAYARGTWEQWAPSLEELVIEIFAPLVPLPLYHHRN